MRELLRSAVAAGACALLAGAVAPATAFADPTVTIEGYSTDVRAEAVSALVAERGLGTATAEALLRTQEAATSALDAALAQLGDSAAGGYLDESGAPVVNVVDEAAAASVEGVTTRLVTRTTAELESAREELEALPQAPHTAIAVDPVTNQVVVTVGEAATGAAGTAGLLAAAERMGDTVRIEQVAGGFEPAIYGGEAITGGGSRCSAGFNVNSGGQDYIVDAGHCTAAVSQWNVGPSVDASFPGDDYGLIRNDTGSAPGAVSLHDGSVQKIASASDAHVGQSICKSGSTTGLTCGTVEATNVTVNYPQGAVHELVQTSASAGSGDSGGALFAGSVGLGITSGMGGDSSFFQPLTEALGAYGVRLN
ncbi:S1 family peptidase [Saccharomonospora xinjiangensis]|uniref:S1 family peptidase n=1 Tax=Saccharomonospora xinjiangensis TaxID=75294 RepID=UPI00106FAB51|nr:S1 family peptidase [Saccharomonospora xinjiangensis]QBQ58796.1 Streptogrisin-D precursor [Saccharomonospora xinjiangensis]